MNDRSDLKTQILELANECAKKYHCFVDNLKLLRKVGKISLTIEREDGVCMALDTCAQVNKEFAKLISVHFPQLKQSCDIEVSSAGLDKIVPQKQYSRYIGRRVSVNYNTDTGDMHGIFFILLAQDDKLVLIAEQELKNKLLVKSVNKGHNIATSAQNLAAVDVLIDKCKEYVAKLTNITSNTILYEDISLIALEYDKLLKVRLSPSF